MTYWKLGHFGWFVTIWYNWGNYFRHKCSACMIISNFNFFLDNTVVLRYPLKKYRRTKMFFRDNRSKNSKLPVLQLVENVRTDKGPRQRVVVSLGTRFKIPKSQQSAVSHIIKERLSGLLKNRSTLTRFLMWFANAWSNMKPMWKHRGFRTPLKTSLGTTKTWRSKHRAFPKKSADFDP